MAVQGIVRLTALAVATGTLVAAGAGTATAATAVDSSRVLASGKGAAIKITLNLPSALASALGTATIVQEISTTTGEVSTVTTPLAVSKAVLGVGNTPVLADLLKATTSASLTGKMEDRSGSPLDIDQAGIKLRLLPLSSKVAQPTTNGTIAASSSGVAQLRIGGLATGLDAVTAPVQDVLDTALGTVDSTDNTATGAVGSVITGALDQLDAASGNASAPLTDQAQAAVDTVTKTLEGTLDNLVDTLGTLDAATDIVTMDTITSDQVISRKGNQVTSTVENSIKQLNVLNGLVKIEGITSAATASAGGRPGTADASFVPTVLKVSVANDALTALLDQNGLNVGGTVGSALPKDLQNTVNGAINTVNDLLLDLAGVDVQLGAGRKSVAEDGTTAVSEVSATKVTVSPDALAPLLPAGKKLLTVELVKANAAAGVQLVAPPARTPGTNVATPTSLPRTGGELGLAAAATVMMGVALVARRRRSVYVG